MFVLEYYGKCLAHQKIVPGNTSTGINSALYKYTRYKLNYDAGSDEIDAGDWIVGATSGAVAHVISVTLSTGEWGAGDNAAGYFIIDNKYGTFQNNEAIKMGTDATCAVVNETIHGDATPLESDYTYKGAEVKSALICVYPTNPALINLTGATPDYTSFIGIPMATGSSILLSDSNDIRDFRCVDYTNGSACTVQVALFY